MKHKWLIQITFILLALTITNIATAQDKEIYNKKILQMPVEYIKPTGIVATRKAKKLPVSGPKNDWVVYSDRANNPTYETPNGAKTGKMLQFMESFYVIDETKNYVQLIKRDLVSIKGNSRKVNTEKAEYCGWVEKSKLLLWRNALVNKQTDFSIKGLSVRSLSTLKSDIQSGKKDLHIFDHPELMADAENNSNLPLFEFLFIFKKEKNRYLVGTSDKLPLSFNAFKEVRGWIDSRYIQIWSQRLCLEPNHNKEAATERKNKGIKSSVFSTYESADTFRIRGTAPSDKVIWDKDQYDNKYTAAWKRFPVLARLENNVYKIGLITNIFDRRNHKLLPIKEYMKLERDYRALFPTGEMNYEVFLEAYVPVEMDSLKLPLFKHVLLLTNEELHDLEELLVKLVEVKKQNTELRKAMTKTFREILKAHSKEEINKYQADTKTPGEIFKMVVGISSKTQILQKYTISELEDEKAVSDDEVDAIFFYIENKLEKVKRIANNSEYLFRTNEETYYWMPEIMFP